LTKNLYKFRGYKVNKLTDSTRHWLQITTSLTLFSQECTSKSHPTIHSTATEANLHRSFTVYYSR